MIRRTISVDGKHYGGATQQIDQFPVAAL